MLIVRSLRQDRISICVTDFVIKNLGTQFVEPPILDMKAVRHLLTHTNINIQTLLTLRLSIDHTYSNQTILIIIQYTRKFQFTREMSTYIFIKWLVAILDSDYMCYIKSLLVYPLIFVLDVIV